MVVPEDKEGAGKGRSPEQVDFGWWARQGQYPDVKV